MGGARSSEDAQKSMRSHLESQARAFFRLKKLLREKLEEKDINSVFTRVEKLDEKGLAEQSHVIHFN
jgi:hypothetical protein